jgi:hypothetical protein
MVVQPGRLHRPVVEHRRLERELVDAANREPRLLVPRWVWRAGPSADPSPCIPIPGYQPTDDVVTPARRQVADNATDLDYWLDGPGAGCPRMILAGTSPAVAT